MSGTFHAAVLLHLLHLCSCLYRLEHHRHRTCIACSSLRSILKHLPSAGGPLAVPAIHHRFARTQTISKSQPHRWYTQEAHVESSACVHQANTVDTDVEFAGVSNAEHRTSSRKTTQRSLWLFSPHLRIIPTRTRTRFVTLRPIPCCDVFTGLSKTARL